MTEAIAVPLDLKKLMAEAAARAVEEEKPDNKFISFKSGVLSLNGNAAKDNKIQVAIVGWCFENQFFPGKYDPKNIVSPECWAVGHVEDDLTPDPECNKVVAPDCYDCAYNEWESDLAGGKGKACKNIRRLAMILQPDIGKPMEADVLFARLPVTSVANWAKYVAQIGNVVKRPAWGVLTEVSVVPDMKTQFKVGFQFMGLIEDEHLEGIHTLYDKVYKDILFPNPRNPEPEVAAAQPAKGTKKF